MDATENGRFNENGTSEKHTPPLRPPRPHPVRQYVARVASLDVEEYPKWDLTVSSVIYLRNSF